MEFVLLVLVGEVSCLTDTCRKANGKRCLHCLQAIGMSLCNGSAQIVSKLFFIVLAGNVENVYLFMLRQSQKLHLHQMLSTMLMLFMTGLNEFALAMNFCYLFLLFLYSSSILPFPVLQMSLFQIELPESLVASISLAIT